MRHYFSAAVAALLLFVPTLAAAQGIETKPSSAITTAGADCSTATSCVSWSMEGVAVARAYVNVGASGTFVLEVTSSTNNSSDNTVGVWEACDSCSAASLTADGSITIVNTGIRRARFRASAISGAAAVTVARGLSPNPGSVSLGDVTIDVTTLATHAKQDTIIGHVDGLEALLGTSNTNTAGITTALDAKFGTAGTADADVITVQGIASMTPLLVTASAGTNLNTSALALEATALLILEQATNAANELGTLNGNLADPSVDDEPALTDGSMVHFLCETGAVNALDDGDAGAVLVDCTTRRLMVNALIAAGDLDIGNVDLEFAGSAASVGIGASGSTTLRVVQAQQTPYRSIDLDETDEDVKAGAGEVCSLWVSNTATTTRFVHLYNTNSPTVGTTTPLITIAVPGNTSDDVSGSFGVGNGCIGFDTAISAAATTTLTGADAPSANDVIVMVGYR